MSSHRNNESLRPLSDLLGPEGHRYFAAGYKRVRYCVAGAEAEFGGGGVLTMQASAEYPLDWSRDAAGAAREAHLSSVDSIVLPLIALEHLIDPAELSTYWIEHVEIRAPRRPVTSLLSIPLQLTLTGSPGWSSVFDLAADVGGMRTRMRLRREEAEGSGVVDDGGFSSVYSEGFRHTSITTHLIDGADLSEVSAQHEFEIVDISSMPSLQGIEASFAPAPSIIDLLVTVGQLNQAAIYAPLPVAARRGELWLRSMTIDRTRPPAKIPATLRSATRTLRDRLHLRGTQRLHDISTECIMHDTTAVRATVAYIEPPGSSQEG